METKRSIANVIGRDLASDVCRYMIGKNPTPIDCVKYGLIEVFPKIKPHATWATVNTAAMYGYAKYVHLLWNNNIKVPTGFIELCGNRWSPTDKKLIQHITNIYKYKSPNMKYDNGNRWASSMRTFGPVCDHLTYPNPCVGLNRVDYKNEFADGQPYKLQTNNFDILMDIAVDTYNIELYNMLLPRYDTNKRSANSNRVTPFVVCEYNIKKSILYRMVLSEQMNDDALAFLTMLIEKYSAGNLFIISKRLDNKILYRYLKKIMGVTKYILKAS